MSLAAPQMNRWADAAPEPLFELSWLRFPTIPFPAGIMQHLQRDNEKESFLLQPSGIKPGCRTWDTGSQVKGAAANFCVFLVVSDQAQAVPSQIVLQQSMKSSEVCLFPWVNKLVPGNDPVEKWLRELILFLPGSQPPAGAT